jgi:hypothetical protein
MRPTTSPNCVGVEASPFFDTRLRMDPANRGDLRRRIDAVMIMAMIYAVRLVGCFALVLTSHAASVGADR